jgi:hypothetical protein
MGTKSRESIYGSSIRASAERAREARKEADHLACDAWNQRMLGYRGPAQPSPTLGDALNAGYRLDHWVKTQRDAKDRMEPPRRQRLETLPGWSWNVLSRQWDEGLFRLKEFAEREGQAA